jgi:hypothetical protein
MSVAAYSAGDERRAQLLGSVYGALASVAPSDQPASEHVIAVVAGALSSRQREHLDHRSAQAGALTTFELRLLAGVGAALCGWQEHPEVEGGALRRALEVVRDDLLALRGLPAVPLIAIALLGDLLATCTHFWPHNQVLATVAAGTRAADVSAFDAACLAAAAAAAVQAASSPPAWTSPHDEW